MARHLEETDIPIEYKGMKYNVSPSALRSNNLTVELPEVKVLGKRKNKEYKSAFNPNGAGEFVGAMMNSPLQLGDYAFNRFIDAGKGEHGKTNYRYTPVQTTAQRVGETLSPTRWIGTLKSGFKESPWSENNPGLTGNPYLDLVIDIGAGGLGIKGAKRFNKINKNKSTSIETWTPEQWTAAQDKAIAEGDMVRAQILRDLHFKVKTPNNKAITENGLPIKTYHTVGDKYDYRFNVFDPTIEGSNSMIYTTDSRPMSRSYLTGKLGSLNPKTTKELYINSESPYIVESQKSNWNNITIPTRDDITLLEAQQKDASLYKDYINNISKEYGISPLEEKNYPSKHDVRYNVGSDNYLDDFVKKVSKSDLNTDKKSELLSKISTIFPSKYTKYNLSTRDIETLINKLKKYDSIQFNDIADWGGGAHYEPLFTEWQNNPYHNVYAVKNPAKLKYADAVTYDKNGVRIPLGIRDNFKNKDLRYGLIPLTIGGKYIYNNLSNNNK